MVTTPISISITFAQCYDFSQTLFKIFSLSVDNLLGEPSLLIYFRVLFKPFVAHGTCYRT